MAKDKTRILITGASGMLGATLSEHLKLNFEIFATGNSDFENCDVNYRKFNLSDGNYQELVNWSKPDVIVLCGALTNGNFCDKNPSEAFKINGLSVRKFIDATDVNTKFIYISTDAVFPSRLHNALESDCVSPENIYGKSKELGEFFLINSDRHYTIIRTTIVGLNINKSKQGFVEWIINSVKEGKEISLFNDVLFNPISIWDLSNEIEFLVENELINKEIYHIAGQTICTKYEFGVALLSALKLPHTNVNKGSIMNFNDRAKRCADQTLNTNFYQTSQHRKLPSLQTTVDVIKNKYYELN